MCTKKVAKVGAALAAIAMAALAGGCSNQAAALELGQENAAPAAISVRVQRMVRDVRVLLGNENNSVQRGILEDYWVTDTELEEIRHASESCIAQFLPDDLSYSLGGDPVFWGKTIPVQGEWSWQRMYFPETDAHRQALAAAGEACGHYNAQLFWNLHTVMHHFNYEDPRELQFIACLEASEIVDADEVTLWNLDEFWNNADWWNSTPAIQACAVEAQESQE
ncbi:MAG: hypothetical protein LBB58_00205 [Cellulomonadaceae bacterium]|jgi:hypothetical protein|nr:hypothetical protein [Cellulomonadaceae bacterium]